MEIKGKVHEVGEIQQISDTFKKRDLIIEYAENPSYPEYIKFETLQDKTALLNLVAPGDEVEVSFNLRGRPWTDKTGKTSYFNSLVVWRLNVVDQHQASNDPPQYAAPETNYSSSSTDDDDLPF